MAEILVFALACGAILNFFDSMIYFIENGWNPWKGSDK